MGNEWLGLTAFQVAISKYMPYRRLPNNLQSSFDNMELLGITRGGQSALLVSYVLPAVFEGNDLPNAMSFMDSFLAEGSEIRGILEDFDSPSGKGLIMGMAILIEGIAKNNFRRNRYGCI